jgi:hypothetical protein
MTPTTAIGVVFYPIQTASENSRTLQRLATLLPAPSVPVKLLFLRTRSEVYFVGSWR